MMGLLYVQPKSHSYVSFNINVELFNSACLSFSKVAIEVSDFGLPYRLNSTSKVTIFVEDVNDNIPEFKQNVMK